MWLQTERLGLGVPSHIPDFYLDTKDTPKCFNTKNNSYMKNNSCVDRNSTWEFLIKEAAHPS